MSFNPPNPLLTRMQGGLRPGMVILIAGIVLPDAKRFEINLQTGGGKYLSNDIALHFNPRFPDAIVRDTYLDYKWIHHQRDGSNPLSYLDSYVIRILVKVEKYEISINGVHFCDYVHLIRFQKVTHLAVLGDTTLTTVGFEWVSQVIPYIPVIPGGHHIAMELEVTGVIKAGAQRFHIDLQCGEGEFLSQDIALHFKHSFPNGGIVLNHYQCDHWGFEDIFGTSLLSVSRPFRIQILTKDRGYKIFVNDCFFTDYHHRLQPWRVTRLGVHGDIKLTGMSFSWNVQMNKIAIRNRSGQTNDTLLDSQHTTSPPQLAASAPESPNPGKQDDI